MKLLGTTMRRDGTAMVWVLAGLTALYVGGYVVARRTHAIVHTTQRASSCEVDHQVVDGDSKLGSPNPLIALVYTPLRVTERIGWVVFDPC